MAFVGEINYIGTAGRNLMSFDGPGGEDYNRVGGDLADGRRDRLNPSFGAVGLAESRIDSNFHGMTLQLNRRFIRGFSFQTAYTLGQAKDYPGSAEEVTNLEREYGPTSTDVRHNLALNVIWQIPYTPANAFLRNTVGGWQLNAVTIWRSGTAFTVTCGNCDFNLDGIEGDRVNLPSFGTDLGSISDEKWLAGALVATDFSRPAAGQLGTMPRNGYRGPAYFDTDLSVFKNIIFGPGGRQRTLQVRVEAYNVFNTLNLANPNANVANTNFGRVTGLRTPGGGLPGSRLIQLGAKFMF